MLLIEFGQHLLHHYSPSKPPKIYTYIHNMIHQYLETGHTSLMVKKSFDDLASVDVVHLDCAV